MADLSELLSGFGFDFDLDVDLDPVLASHCRTRPGAPSLLFSLAAASLIA